MKRVSQHWIPKRNDEATLHHMPPLDLDALGLTGDSPCLP